MIYIKKPTIKKDDSIFIDESGKEWKKALSREYVVIGNIDTFTSAATLFYSNEPRKKFKYVDVNFGFEAYEANDRESAITYFEEYMEILFEGNIFWDRYTRCVI